MEALEPDQGQWPGKGCWLVRAFLMLYQCWIGDLSEWVNWSSPPRGMEGAVSWDGVDAAPGAEANDGSLSEQTGEWL